jgi:prepilin-type N-terminal cleavage/methylation domain-containing protein
MRRTTNQENGFTLLESVVVIAIMMIMMSFAIFKSTNMLPNYKADSAQDVVVSSLRQARQLAITERRDVQVWFDQSFSGAAQVQHINYQVVTIGGDQPQAMVSVGLPQGSQFLVEAGVPDTPMLFGNSAPVYIGSNGAMVGGGPAIMKFRSTGSFTDSVYSPLNGTIFVGVPNQTSTARAVTIIGGTGRVRPYSWTGTVWVE